jgi:hypothetical protein
MEVKLKFDDEVLTQLLIKNGYKIDTILVWYPKYPLSIETASRLGELVSFHMKVAYPENIKCPWEGDEKPLAEKYKVYKYENIVEKVVSKLILKKLF